MGNRVTMGIRAAPHSSLAHELIPASPALFYFYIVVIGSINMLPNTTSVINSTLRKPWLLNFDILSYRSWNDENQVWCNMWWGLFLWENVFFYNLSCCILSFCLSKMWELVQCVSSRWNLRLKCVMTLEMKRLWQAGMIAWAALVLGTNSRRKTTEISGNGKIM